MNKPLAGVRVLDLTHMLSGPYAGMILADLGAETIKVEPLQGEGTRTLLASDPENSLGGMGAYFLTLNRNKKSVAIDLKSGARYGGVPAPGGKVRYCAEQFCRRRAASAWAWISPR